MLFFKYLMTFMGINFLGVRVAEWLSHSAVVQEVPGSNTGDAESVGEWRNY